MDREIVINHIIKEIKRKQEFRGIYDGFIRRLAIYEISKRTYFDDYIKGIKNEKDLKRDIVVNDIIRTIKAKLHDTYGIFLPKSIKRVFRILDSNIPIEQKITEILRQFKSTRERINFYREIYDNIFVEKPKNIIDMASGVNPISIYFSEYKPEIYSFIDVSEDIVYINSYILDNLKIKNNGIVGDIMDTSLYEKNRFHYAFLWKALPSIEYIRKGYSKVVLDKLNAKYIIVSFSLRKISGKDRMGKAWITWIKKISNILNIDIIKELTTPNEYFIILKK